MKKIILYVITIIMVLSMAFTFSACNDSGSTQGGLPLDDPNAKGNPYTLSGVNVFDDGCYILLDFETYWEVVQPVWGRSFGKVTMITDKEYVTRGNQCVKLEILGEEQWVGYGVNPLLYLETNNQYFQKSDFSDCDYFAFDIYNALDVVNTIPSFSIDGSDLTCKDIELQPGWNYVTIEIPEGVDMSNCTSFWIQFNRGEKFKETQVFYLDNFRAHKKAVVNETPDASASEVTE